jgi:hypothetical protein
MTSLLMHIFDPIAVLGLLLVLGTTIPGLMLSAGQLNSNVAIGVAGGSAITSFVLSGVLMWQRERRRKSTAQPPIVIYELCQVRTV